MSEMTTEIEPLEKTSAPKWALASLSLALALSSLSTSIANVALPTLTQVFAAPFQLVQWVVLANLLTMTTVIVSVGRLGDMLGRRRLLLAGLVVFVIASGLCSVAPNVWVLIAARALQGVGAATMMALTTAFVGEIVPKEKIGSAMGLLGTASAIGTSLGPSLGGVLIAAFGWRAIFVAVFIFGAVAVVMVRRFLPTDHKSTQTESRFDVVGTVLLTVTLAAYALAMTMGRGSFSQLNVVLLIAAFVGLGVFILIETKVAAPLVQVAVFRKPVLSAGFAMSALVMTVAMTTMVVGPFYLSGALGLDAVHVGLVLSVGPIVAALTGVPAGQCVDRFGSHRMTVVGLMGVLAGAFALAMIPPHDGVVGYVVPLIVLTAGYAIFQAANNTGVMADVPITQRGVISGLLNLSRNLGLITGASVMGAVFAAASGTQGAGHPEAVAAGLRLTFLIASGLMVIALVIATRGRSFSRT